MIRPRRGVSLLELLIVITIIGILLSLLLPAVFRAFEQANRMKCQNNWYQMRLSGSMEVPPVPNPDNHPLPPYSIYVVSLANMEQSALYDMYNFECTFDSAPNSTVLSHRPGFYNCPNTGGDRSRTTYAYDLRLETKPVNGKTKVFATFIGCEVSPEYAFLWTDPRGYEPSIVDAIKAKDGRRAFFRNHGDGHFVNSAVVSAFGGNPNGGGMEFNTDEGLILRAWRSALHLDDSP
jgi:prepilin-type N-terminal cleavage/methylation domain-containing protein